MRPWDIPPAAARMKRETSVYLDLIRCCAAGVVFLGHIGTQNLGGGLFWQFSAYGAAAVVLFFVLSGYVIADASARRPTTGRVYATARAARLYSVVVPALALTAGLDWVGPGPTRGCIPT